MSNHIEEIHAEDKNLQMVFPHTLFMYVLLYKDSPIIRESIDCSAKSCAYTYVGEIKIQPQAIRDDLMAADNAEVSKGEIAILVGVVPIPMSPFTAQLVAQTAALDDALSEIMPGNAPPLEISGPNPDKDLSGPAHTLSYENFSEAKVDLVQIFYDNKHKCHEQGAEKMLYDHNRTKDIALYCAQQSSAGDSILTYDKDPCAGALYHTRSPQLDVRIGRVGQGLARPDGWKSQEKQEDSQGSADLSNELITGVNSTRGADQFSNTSKDLGSQDPLPQTQIFETEDWKRCDDQSSQLEAGMKDKLPSNLSESLLLYAGPTDNVVSTIGNNKQDLSYDLGASTDLNWADFFRSVLDTVTTEGDLSSRSEVDIALNLHEVRDVLDTQCQYVVSAVHEKEINTDSLLDSSDKTSMELKAAVLKSVPNVISNFQSLSREDGWREYLGSPPDRGGGIFANIMHNFHVDTVDSSAGSHSDRRAESAQSVIDCMIDTQGLGRPFGWLPMYDENEFVLIPEGLFSSEAALNGGGDDSLPSSRVKPSILSKSTWLPGCLWEGSVEGIPLDIWEHPIDDSNLGSDSAVDGKIAKDNVCSAIISEVGDDIYVSSNYPQGRAQEVLYFQAVGQDSGWREYLDLNKESPEIIDHSQCLMCVAKEFISKPWNSFMSMLGA